MFVEMMNQSQAASNEFIPFGEVVEEGQEVTPFVLDSLVEQESKIDSIMFSSLSIGFTQWTQGEPGETVEGEMPEFDVEVDFSLTLMAVLPFEVPNDMIQEIGLEASLLSQQLIQNIQEDVSEFVQSQDFDSEALVEFTDEILSETKQFEKNILNMLEFHKNNLGALAQESFKKELKDTGVNDQVIQTMLSRNTEGASQSIDLQSIEVDGEFPFKMISFDDLKEIKSVYQLNELLKNIAQKISQGATAPGEASVQLEKLVQNFKGNDLSSLTFENQSLEVDKKILTLKSLTYKELTVSASSFENSKAVESKGDEFSKENKLFNEIKSVSVNEKRSEQPVQASIDISKLDISRESEKSEKAKVFIWKNGKHVEVSNLENKLNPNAQNQDQKEQLQDSLRFEEKPTRKKTEKSMEESTPENKFSLFTEDSSVLKDGANKGAFAQSITDLKMSTSAPVKEKPFYSSNVQQSIINQLDNQMLKMTEKGVKELTLELYPAHLGRVEVKMDLEKDHLNIQLKVESEEVRKVIEGQMSNLRESLELQNVQLAKTEVQIFSGDKNFSSHANNEKRNTKNKNSNSKNEQNLEEETNDEKRVVKYGYNTVEYTA